MSTWAALGQPIIFILRGRCEVSPSPLPVWARSIVLLIRTPAASSREPPLWTQTCLNGCVVTHVVCSRGQSTRHPFWIDITDKSSHEHGGSPNNVPHQGLVCGLHSFDLACSRPVPVRLGPGIRPRFWTVSASACPITLVWIQSLTLVNLRIKHQLLLWAFTGPGEPNLWTTEGHTWIPGVLGAVRDQQHSGSLSYETPWDRGRPTWRSSSGPLRESPSRAAESKAMLCLWTPEAGHLGE